MHALVKAWGNSFAIRLTRRDLERWGLREGQEIEVEIRPAAAPVDLSRLPILRGLGTLEQARQAHAATRARDWDAGR